MLKLNLLISISIKNLIKIFFVQGIKSVKFRIKVFFKSKLTHLFIKRFLKREKIFLEIGLNDKKDGDWITLSIEGNSDLTYDL